MLCPALGKRNSSLYGLPWEGRRGTGEEQRNTWFLRMLESPSHWSVVLSFVFDFELQQLCSIEGGNTSTYLNCNQYSTVSISNPMPFKKRKK